MTVDKARRILRSIIEEKFDEPILPEDIQALAQAYIDHTTAITLLHTMLDRHEAAQ